MIELKKESEEINENYRLEYNTNLKNKVNRILYLRKKIRNYKNKRIN